MTTITKESKQEKLANIESRLRLIMDKELNRESEVRVFMDMIDRLLTAQKEKMVEMCEESKRTLIHSHPMIDDHDRGYNQALDDLKRRVEGEI